MKTKISFAILILTLILAPTLAQAQNWTTVTATNITDLNQQKLAAGQLCFLATDRNDNPISIGIGGGGQLLRRAFCSAVSNGAVSGLSVPNPANTAPAGVNYRVTVNDTSVGKEVLRYTQVVFAGTNFNFDGYAPTGAALLVPLGNTVNGNLNVNGNLSITGALATSAFGNISATAYNNVVEADTQTGSDACAQIAAAIAALPATGGTVDARGIQAAQACAANPFASSAKPVQLLLGGVTITTSACWALPSDTVIVGAGRGISTLKLANGVNSCFVISNLHPSTGDNHIAVTGLTIDGNMLNQSPTGSQRTGCVFFERTQYFWIENNELLNCYNFSVEALGQSQYGWVRSNRIDGTLQGSGVLFGTGPLSTDSTGLISEAYDMWAEDNWIGNTQADCLFTTGSNTLSAYGTARIHFKNNTLFNCGDVSIEIGDSSRDSEAMGNIIQMPPAVSISGTISRSSNVVTATFTCTWSSDLSCLTAFMAGAAFRIAGVTDGTFNGSFTVLTVNYLTNTLTWAQVAGNASSSGGTAIRTGNQALLSRSSLNTDFKGNVVNGTGSASDNGCEMTWHNIGGTNPDNAPKTENISWDDICNAMGGTAFKIVADTAGSVTQVKHASKFDGTVGNDYIMATNQLNVRLMSGGYFTAGSAFAGASFNQSNDLNFEPGSGQFEHMFRNMGISNNGSTFMPSAPVHVQTGGNFADILTEATVDANEGMCQKNAAPQQWCEGVRQDQSEAYCIRDITSGVTTFCQAKSTGNISLLTGKFTNYNNLAVVGEGLTSIRAFTSQRAETGVDANVITLTPPATAGTYRLNFVLSVSAANAATLGWTATWKDSNGNAAAPTNLSLFQNGTAASALTFTTSAAGTYQGSAVIDIDSSATNIVIKLTFTGTSFSGKATAAIERMN